MSPRYYQRIVILSLKKCVNRDKCNFAKKHRLFGVFDEAPSRLLALYATLAPYSCLFALNASECDVQQCNECIFIQTSSMDSHVSSSIPDSQIPANRLQPKNNLTQYWNKQEVNMKIRKHSMQVIRFSPSRFPISLDHST